MDDEVDDDEQMECQNDLEQRVCAPHCRMQNGVHHRNVNVVNFGADENNPSSQFGHIWNGFNAFTELTEAMVMCLSRVCLLLVLGGLFKLLMITEKLRNCFRMRPPILIENSSSLALNS